MTRRDPRAWILLGAGILIAASAVVYFTTVLILAILRPQS
jgi:fumarate reductase subunit D